MPVHIPQPRFDKRSVPAHCVRMTEKQVREIIKRADRNKDGCLSMEELKKVLKEKFGSRMPAIRAHCFFRVADTNHDGQISEDGEIDLLVNCILKWLAGKQKE